MIAPGDLHERSRTRYGPAQGMGDRFRQLAEELEHAL